MTVFKAFYVIMSICLTQLNVLFCFQELLVILCLLIVVTPFATKDQDNDAMAAATVLWTLKELGGTGPVMHPT